MKKLNVAIIGQGRSGRQIHGAFLLGPNNDKFNVKYVVDANEVQRGKAKEAFKDAEILKDYKELFDKKDIDFVINASYSKDHYPVSKDLLAHGFNVLCEKPFCRNEKECADLIKTARKNNCIIAVFQQTMLSPFYLHAKETIESGKLGEILQVTIHYSGFSRRWDWQTLQKMMGGSTYNTGPHPVGLGLGFLDFDKNTKIIYSNLKHTEMSAGDYDDYAKILLGAPNKPTIDIEVTSTDDYSPFNIIILGSRGCYKTTMSNYEMKYVIPGENVERTPVFETLTNENGEPCYCSEKLITHEEKGEHNGSPFDVGTKRLYDSVYEAIVNGKPLLVTPEMAMMTTKVISDAHKANPIEQKFF